MFSFNCDRRQFAQFGGGGAFVTCCGFCAGGFGKLDRLADDCYLLSSAWASSGITLG